MHGPCDSDLHLLFAGFPSAQLWIWTGDLLMVAKLNFVSYFLFLKHFTVCLSHFVCPHTNTEHQPSLVGGWQPHKPTVSQPMCCMAVGKGNIGQGYHIKLQSVSLDFQYPQGADVFNFWSLKKRSMPRIWVSRRRIYARLPVLWIWSLPKERQDK